MEVILVSRYFDTRNQGIGSYSKLIYDSLNQKGLKANTLSIEDRTSPFYFPLYYQFWIVADLKLLLSKEKYKTADVIHSLSPLESLHVPKHKAVSSILDFIPLTMRKTLDDRIFCKIFEKGINSSINCERIVVLNSDLKNILISDYGVDESVIEVIPPAIDNKYCPIKKSNDSFVVGTVSSLTPRKRIEILLKSFLKADIEDSKLLIGGSGPELQNLKNISNNDERVKFLGFLNDEDME